MLTDSEQKQLQAIRERQASRETASGSDMAETDFLLTVIHKLGGSNERATLPSDKLSQSVLDEPFTAAELRLLSQLLFSASDEYSNHGCNDLPLPGYFDENARIRLSEHYSKWNGDPEEDTRPGNKYFRGGDSGALAFFAAKIEHMAEMEKSKVIGEPR